ncbi:ABC transporter substrate-binding protein [Streptococcus suis]|uniref:ABC transporter substrate-binding protein n=2 Tax=Streptococcus suis TaxID=1307 RepID=UPI0039BDB074
MMDKMKLSKKHAWLVSLVLVVLFGLGLLIHMNPTKKVVLTVGTYTGSNWNVPSGQGTQFLDQVIRVFEEKYPQVEVRYETGIDKADYSDWLSDQLVSGTQPDIFIVPERDFNLLASTGSLANLSPLLQQKIDHQIYYTEALHAGQYNGMQFALPFETNPIMMCINNDLLEKEGIALPQSGWTLADFYRICQQVTKDTDGDGVIDQYGSVGYTWQHAVAGMGVNLFDAKGTEAHFNTSEMAAVLDFLSKIEELQGNYQSSSSDFDQGNVAFMPMTLAEYRTYKPYPYHVSKYSSFEWTCIDMPKNTGIQKATQMETALYAISSRSTKQALSKEFLELLCANQELQQAYFEQSQGASPLKSVMTSRESQNLLQGDSFGTTALTTETLNQLLSTALPQEKFKSYYKILETADYLIRQSLTSGNREPKLSTIQREIEKQLP